MNRNNSDPQQTADINYEGLINVKKNSNNLYTSRDDQSIVKVGGSICDNILVAGESNGIFNSTTGDSEQIFKVLQSIESNAFSQDFCVCDPQKSRRGDHYEYLVIGYDSHGPY